MTQSLEIVPFYEYQIMTVKTDKAIHVVMKPIVEALGMTWHGQFERINRHPVIGGGGRVMRIPTAGGAQDVVTLDLESFYGWLLSLMPDRITDPDKRAVIIRYQKEAFRVIFEHYHGPIGRIGRTKRSVTSIIATQNQVMKLMRQLQKTYHPEERRALHQMLDGMCKDIKIDTPPLDQLGKAAPALQAILTEFWKAYDVLLDRGKKVNMSRKSQIIALHFPTLREALKAENIDLSIDKDLQRALEKSLAPKFLARKPVNCRDGKNRHCWVFEALD